MHFVLRIAAALAGIGILASPAFAQSSSSSHDAHHAKVNERGDHVMGFDHEKTTHHFRLTQSGGSIEVSVKDPGDAESLDAVRRHLAHVASMFAEGDFDAPMLIHDRIPPGVATLKARKDRIHWTYEDMKAGGRILVTSEDTKARSAIHDFLRFQIEDHQTGDSTAVQK